MSVETGKDPVSRLWICGQLGPCDSQVPGFSPPRSSGYSRASAMAWWGVGLADSSIEVQGTGGWLLAVRTDDDSLDSLQFACVTPQGTVVLQAIQVGNDSASPRVLVLFLPGFFPLEASAFVVLWPPKRQLHGPA